MKKELKHEDKAKIQRTQEGVNVLKLQINDMLSRFAEMPNGKLKGNKTLMDVLTNPKNAYRNIIKSLIPETDCGLPVDKEAKLRLMTFPDFTELTEMNDKLRMDANQYEIDHVNSGVFELESETTVKVNNSAKELLFDRFRVYANNSDESKLLDLQTEFVNSFVALRTHAEKAYGNNNVKSYFDLSSYGNIFDINKLITQDSINPDFSRSLKVYQK